MNSTDVAAVDETSPVCVFAWHYVTRHQLELLVRGVPRVTPHTRKPLGFTFTPAGKPEALQPNELTPALEFLRVSNRLLVSLLTADQKSKFIKLLSTCPEAQELLQAEQLRTLDRVGYGTAPPTADTSTAPEQASDHTRSVTTDPGRAGRTRGPDLERRVAPGAVSRPRRTSTVPGKYREPSSE